MKTGFAPVRPYYETEGAENTVPCMKADAEKRRKAEAQEGAGGDKFDRALRQLKAENNREEQYAPVRPYWEEE